MTVTNHDLQEYADARGYNSWRDYCKYELSDDAAMAQAIKQQIEFDKPVMEK